MSPAGLYFVTAPLAVVEGQWKTDDPKRPRPAEEEYEKRQAEFVAEMKRNQDSFAPNEKRAENRKPPSGKVLPEGGCLPVCGCLWS